MSNKIKEAFENFTESLRDAAEAFVCFFEALNEDEGLKEQREKVCSRKAEIVADLNAKKEQLTRKFKDTDK